MDLIGTKPLTGRGLASSVFVCAFLIGFMSSNAWSGSGSDRFTKDSQGIITDKQTGLQWFVGPEKGTSWEEAQSWVHSLSVGGGGWRMPTMSELRFLYLTGSSRCKRVGGGVTSTYQSYIDPLFGCVFDWVWGDNSDQNIHLLFSFAAESQERWVPRGLSSTDYEYLKKQSRAFAVRSR